MWSGRRLVLSMLTGAVLLQVAGCQPVVENRAERDSPAALPGSAGAAEPGAGNELHGEPWRLIGIERPGSAKERIAATPRYTITFGADGRIAGQVHCNRFMGIYASPAAGRLDIESGAITRAACPEPSIADEYLRMLTTVESYEMRGDELLLAMREGGMLQFVREPPVIVGGPWVDAARRGVTFRALGNEPYWTLEVVPGRLTMITDLGERRTELSSEEPSVDGSRTTWRAAGVGHEILAVAERRPCSDTMSDEKFDVAVTVTFDDTTFRGCGRFL